MTIRAFTLPGAVYEDIDVKILIDVAMLSTRAVSAIKLYGTLRFYLSFPHKFICIYEMLLRSISSLRTIAWSSLLDHNSSLRLDSY